MSKTTDINKLVISEYDRLISAEIASDGSATLYLRDQNGDTICDETSLSPYLLTATKELAEELEDATEIIELKGPGSHLFRVCFESVKALKEAEKALKKRTGRNPTDPSSPYRTFSDMQQQFLTMAPARLFRGMTFHDLKRLQLDIETMTTPGFDFPNAEREEDEIIIISLRDNSGWEYCLSGPEMSEKEMLQKMVELIFERDPDVIEGHNLFNFDLPYIEKRCKRHKVKLNIGRDGSKLKGRPSRFSAGERTLSYKRYEAFGRHIIDTLHLVILYDVIHRDLESYNLKAVARYFEVAAPERTYVEGSKITELYKSNPEELRKYAMDDVRETAAISEILSPSCFYQAQIIPYSYQSCVTRGNASRIDALLISKYLTNNQGLPAPEKSRQFQGGLTASFETGVFANVWHADVRSLYPSVILSKKLNPSRDVLGVYSELLANLRDFRFKAKDALRDAQTREEKDHFNAIQSSFKILINSFYGYTGFSMGTFNDYDMAEEVTATGREILTNMLDYLKDSNAQVLEMDTDGIYFIPPEEIDSTEEMQQRLQSTLPEGIDIELDSTYQAMFCYKSKNYALLENDGKISISGAALKSRGLEPFQRKFLHEMIFLLLNGKKNEVPDLYRSYEKALKNRDFPLTDLAKRENLSSSPKTYADKLASGKGRRSAAYELALKADRNYRQGDQIAFYITGEKKNVTVVDSAKLLKEGDESQRDDNIPYYMEKLKKLKDKFKAFIPDSSQPDLFDF